MRKERNVAHEDQIVVALDLGEYALQNFLGILPVAAEQFLIGLDHAGRRFEQAFAVRIVARPAQQRPHGFLRLLAAGFFDGAGLV